MGNAEVTKRLRASGGFGKLFPAAFQEKSGTPDNTPPLPCLRPAEH
jgi:hypothetical protein